MKLVLEIELTEREATYIRQCSIERVMNSALDGNAFLDTLEKGVPPHIADKAACWQDIEDSKPIATKMWNAVREAIFKERLRVRENAREDPK